MSLTLYTQRAAPPFWRASLNASFVALCDISFWQTSTFAERMTSLAAVTSDAVSLLFEPGRIMMQFSPVKKLKKKYIYIYLISNTSNDLESVGGSNYL